jgi:hypothetical protein
VLARRHHFQDPQECEYRPPLSRPAEPTARRISATSSTVVWRSETARLDESRCPDRHTNRFGSSAQRGFRITFTIAPPGARPPFISEYQKNTCHAFAAAKLSYVQHHVDPLALYFVQA